MALPVICYKPCETILARLDVADQRGAIASLVPGVREFGPPGVPRVEEIEDPKPSVGEVLVAVEVAGVGYGDVIVRSGRYPFPKPYIPGLEVGGRVAAVGPDVDSSLTGKRVVASTAGMTGGYAELALAEADSVYEVPEGLTLGSAVAVFQAGAIAVGLVSAIQVRPDESALITAAAGRIGSLLVQRAKAAGAATVIAAVGSPAKADVAVEFGADAVVDYTTPGWVAKVRWAVRADPGVGQDIPDGRNCPGRLRLRGCRVETGLTAGGGKRAHVEDPAFATRPPRTRPLRPGLCDPAPAGTAGTAERHHARRRHPADGAAGLPGPRDSTGHPPPHRPPRHRPPRHHAIGHRPSATFPAGSSAAVGRRQGRSVVRSRHGRPCRRNHCGTLSSQAGRMPSNRWRGRSAPWATSCGRRSPPGAATCRPARMSCGPSSSRSTTCGC